MIVPRAPHLARMIGYVGRPVLALFVWDILIVLAYQVLHWGWVGSRSIPLALYGSAIGIIVGFRNNSAYGRWWEARTLWGQIVNNSRSLGRQVQTSIHPQPDAAPGEGEACTALCHRIIYLQVAYVHALRQQLRGLDPVAEVRAILTPEELPQADLDRLAGQNNPALTLQRGIGTLLQQARRQGWIDALSWQSMDRNLDDLMDAQGGSERIKNTPMPKQYDYFPMLFVRIYCLLLPIGMVEALGWFTPLGSTLVGFMFLALDKIGRDLENPFDNAIYDVPLTAITRTIEINLRQLLGSTSLPKPVAPVAGVLW